MYRFKKAHLHQRVALCCISVAGALAAMPAFAETELEALKREVAEQRRMIDRLTTAAQRAPATDAAKPAAALPPATGGSGLDIKVYGVLDVNVSSVDSGYGNKVTLGSGGMEASYIGVSGSKALGKNLTAIGTLEAGIGIDTAGAGNSAAALGMNRTSPSSGGLLGNGPQLFSRQAFAGMQGGFGRVTIGRQYAPSYLAVAGIGSSFVAGFLGNGTTLVSNVGGMPTRLNNSVVYATPSVQGFSATAIYSTGSENNVAGDATSGTVTTNDKAGQGFDLGLFYRSPTLSAAVTTWSVKANSYVTGSETALATKKGGSLNVSYDFGFAKLYATYFDGTISGGNYESVTKTLSKSTGSGLSASIPFGPHKVYVGYATLNDKSLLNRDADLFGIAYAYTITQGATVYANWGKMSNKGASAYPLIAAADIMGNVRAPGVSPSGFLFGVNYKF